jgi:cytochrome c biogenesis protein CcmG, thiol:disulfide interchange protein DsbE
VNRRRRTLLGAGAASALARLAGPDVARGAVVSLDEPAPALRGRLFDGRPFDLRDWRGFVVMVNFYSSYCSICAHEIGNVQTVVERLAPRGLRIVMVSVDGTDDLERTRRFVDNYELPGMLADTAEAIGFERRYPTPTCYVVDRAGVVRAKRTGAKSGDFYRESVLPLLEGRMPER